MMGAARFENQANYIAAVLPAVAHPAPPLPLEAAAITPIMIFSGLGSAAGAVILALLILLPARLSAWLQCLGAYLAGPGLAWLRTLQSGHIGDYLTWLTVGVSAGVIDCNRHIGRYRLT